LIAWKERLPVNISRAFGYAFEDQEWAGKLTILAMIAFISVITTPLLVGLVGWATLLGYSVELIRNLRDQHPTPLPRWDNLGEKISLGGNVLAAVFVYALPNILLSCCVFTLSSLSGESFAGAVSLGSLCCVVPLILVYNLITWPMLALGMARYAEERNIGAFFQFGDLFGTLQRNMGITVQWALYSIVVNLVIGIIGAIPCIGWLIAPALAIPVHGYLTATLGDMIEAPMRTSSKPKRQPY
jgi:hypothetical protein